jgi:Transcriptional activator of glycolytic enzymes
VSDDSVYQLWTEWVFGLDEGPSVEALNHCWGARWRTGSEAVLYSCRLRIINDIGRRKDGTAKDKMQAIDQLEQRRGGRSLD